MSLSAADVAEIMRLVEQSQFDELTLEMDGVKLTLRRGAAVAASIGGSAASVSAGGVAPSSAASQFSTSPAAQEKTENSLSAGTPSVGVLSAATGSVQSRGGADTAATRVTPATESAPLDPNIADVPSPLLGTFYRAPKPGAPPFVEVGAKVEEDTVVAIVEVMKLMNTVRAGVRGTVTEVLASDGALVEYEQPLFRVRKAG